MAACGTCGAAAHGIALPGTSFKAYCASPVSQALATPDRVIAFFRLAGGCTQDNAPTDSGTARDRRPATTSLIDTGYRLDAKNIIHPALETVYQRYLLGQAALVRGVGYPDPNRSHDGSQLIKDTAIRGNVNGGMMNTQSGWAARLSGIIGLPFGAAAFNIGGALVQGGENPVRSLDDIASFGLDRFGSENFNEWLQMSRRMAESDDTPYGTLAYRHLRTQVEKLEDNARLLREAAERPIPTLANPLPNNMSGLQRRAYDSIRFLIPETRNLLGTRLLAFGTGGYDTHANVLNASQNLLSDLDGAIKILIDGFEATGVADWTIVTYSDFGRTNNTNDNTIPGDDHGHNENVFVIGNNVRGGVVYGEPQTDAEWLGPYWRDYRYDFRELLQGAVERLGINPADVFPENFTGRGLQLHDPI